MVILHVKIGDDSQFLFDTTVEGNTKTITNDITAIYNGRLKVGRLCAGIEQLACHGTALPANMMGLTEEQIQELKFIDEWGEICIPSGGFNINKDIYGRRNGKQPSEDMQEVLKKTIEEATAIVSKKKVQAGKCLNMKDIQEAINLLKGAVTIVYPMNLPPHDPIRLEFENSEDIAGTQDALDVIDPALAQIWFSGKEILPDKKLKDYVGRNEKTKITIKLTAAGKGPPGREPIFTEEEKKAMMRDAYKRQEELQKLEQDDDDEYYNAAWADSSSLKRSFQGLTDISWKPK